MLSGMRGLSSTTRLAGLSVLLAFVILGGLIRVLASLDDFVLDEVWSFSLAGRMTSGWDVWRLAHANNHPLNTLLVYLLGDRHVEWYRVPSVLSGIAALGLLAGASRRCDRVESLTTLWLGCVSYLLVLYSAEARGYALAVFFALSAFLAVREYLQSRRAGALAVFWVCVVMGFAAQLSFSIAYLSLTAWAVYDETGNRRSWRITAAELAKVHAVPMVFVAGLYLAYARNLVFSGDVMGLREAIVGVLALAVGAPPGGAGGLAGLAASAALAATGILMLRRASSSEWVFYLCVLLLAPAFVVIIAGTDCIYPRSFIVCLPFFYLLSGRVLARCFRHSVAGKTVFAAALVLFTIGNGFLDYQLLSIGRGGYRRALLYMAEQTRGADIVVASDHDFRNKILLMFYARYLPPGKGLTYVDHKDVAPGNGPEWLVMHESDVHYVPPGEVSAKGGRYVLVKSLPYAGVSGFSWFVYRRAPGP